MVWMHRSVSSVWYKMAYNRFIPSPWLTSLQAVQPQREAHTPCSRQSQKIGHGKTVSTNPINSHHNNNLSKDYPGPPHDRSAPRQGSTMGKHRNEYSFGATNAECNERRMEKHIREQPRTLPTNASASKNEKYKWGVTEFDVNSNKEFPCLPRGRIPSHEAIGFSSNEYFHGSFGTSPYSYVNHTHPYRRSEKHQRNWQRTREYHSNGPHHGKHETPTPRGCRDVATSSANAFQPQPEHQLARTWEVAGAAPKFAKMEKKIRIVSYNILSQKLLDLNRGLYKNCDHNVLPWEYRWKNLSKELRELDADILCLQEVEKYHYRKMISQSLTESGYEFIYKKRTSESVNKPDGVLVAFKQKHFKLVASKKVEYYRGEQKLLNQHNVGVIALLKPVYRPDTSGKTERGYICVVNTHLLYSPKRGDVKLVQLSTLFSEVHRLINEHTDGNVPILLCGDFNSIPSSVIYKFITEQEICYKDTDSKLVSGQQVSRNAQVCLLQDPLLPECLNISDECFFKPDESLAKDGHLSESAPSRKPYYLKHSLGSLVSVHDHSNPKATTTQDRGITVDYIFYSPQVQEKHTSKHTETTRTTSLHLLRRLQLVSPDDLHSVSSIPNAVHSSDHLPIAAEFMIVMS